MNRRLADLGSGQNAALREIVISALFPSVASTTCCGEIGYVNERGNDADFVLECRICGRVRGLTEHKPHGAPAQWSDARITDFASPAAVGAELWLDRIPPSCERPHTYSDCYTVHPYKAEPCRLVAPQVLVYSNRHGGMPVTIINDLGVDATSLYRTWEPANPDWNFRFSLNASTFPIVGTATVINDLAKATRVDLTDAERNMLGGVLEAMWMRAPWSVDSEVSDQAHDLIRNEVRNCASGAESCHIVDWKAFTSR